MLLISGSGRETVVIEKNSWKGLVKVGSEVLFLDLMVVTRVFDLEKFIKANISFVLSSISVFYFMIKRF